VLDLGGKWQLIILYWLADPPWQFGELQQRLPAVSQKVLTEQLGELIADELVARRRTGPGWIRLSG
jgi:DNA-binding HxlR family transcriptional regulator